MSFSGADWSWRSVEGVTLAKGAQKLEIETGTYGTYIDCLYLASDKAFKPIHKNGMDVTAPPAPKNLRVASDGAYIAKLNWMASVASDVHHYNVYVGTDSQFTAEQATLIASPTQPRYIDWQVKATQSNFYRVRAVDFQNNRGQPPI